jgi:hypothetical protein
MPRARSSSAIPRTLVMPERLMSSTIAPQVSRTLSAGGLEFGHGFRVSYLFAFERTGPVGVAKALDVRSTALPRASNPLPSGGQGVLGALADQAASNTGMAAICVRGPAPS